MEQENRFYECESNGFPPVFNYDFDANLAVRSINNTTFRWEEVAVRSIYLMKEATSGGSFEDNTFVIDAPVTNHTGINYITEYTGTNTGSYVGWTVTGGDTLYIGISGLFVNSGDLSAIPYDFQAHPLAGDESIGLHYTGGLSYPGIISDQISTGSEEGIVLGNNHQFFMRAKSNYGTGIINTYLRGWQAGSIVAYYDKDSYSWISTVPTGTYTLTGSNDTIKYKFATDSFPAATPTSFDVVIRSITNTGSFVTIDDVHVDIILRRNAFVDYLVPDGYMIQITPDLGWHDIVSMFDSANSKNPHLTTLGPYTVDLDNLTDNLDNTVTATVTLEDIKSAISQNFKKYLWRAVPLSPNGQLIVGGLPARFEYVGSAIDSLFSIDSVNGNDTSSVKVITGRKSSTMSIVIDGVSNYPGLIYPSPTTWKFTVNIDTSSRVFNILARDITGATTAVQEVKLYNKTYDINTNALWNVFDEHGLVADVERLPGESNFSYSERIKDSHKNKSGPNFSGIINGASRELNIKKVIEAIKITLDKTDNKDYKVLSVDIDVTNYSLRISAVPLVYTETLRVDPVYKTITFRYLPKETPNFIDTHSSKAILPKDVELITEEDESRIVYKAKLNTNSDLVTVSYPHYFEFLFSRYTTLGDLIMAINSTLVAGNKVLTASIDKRLSGNESTNGLYIKSITALPNQSSYLSWSPIYLKKMTDVGYKSSYLDGTNTLKQTDYYSYVKELKNNTKVFWGAVESDRDRWDSADSRDLSMASIPTLFDPPLARYTSVLSGQVVIVDPMEAWARNYIGYNGEVMENEGLTSLAFQPGVAHTNDLMPDIHLTNSYYNTNNNQDYNIGPVKNDNKVVIFSGQK